MQQVLLVCNSSGRRRLGSSGRGRHPLTGDTAGDAAIYPSGRLLFPLSSPGKRTRLRGGSFRHPPLPHLARTALPRDVRLFLLHFPANLGTL